MKHSGRLLHKEASKPIHPDLKDEYGRSAFNRYYYGAFLEARKIFVFLKGPNAKLNHRDLPNFLKTTAIKEVRSIKKKATSLNDHILKQKCASAENSLHQLAQDLIRGYDTRITADYEPDELVKFEGDERFSLNKTHIGVASQWPDTAIGWTQKIMDVLEQGSDDQG